MHYIFIHKEQLERSTEVLKKRGYSKELAERIARFGQAYEYTFYWQEEYGHVTWKDVPEYIDELLDYAHLILNINWDEIYPIFKGIMEEEMGFC